MAKRCIFCGKEFGLFGGCLILCGGSDLSVCSACYDQLSPLSPKERAEKALATGRRPIPRRFRPGWSRMRPGWRNSAPGRSGPGRPSAPTKPVCGAAAPWSGTGRNGST